MSQVKPDSEGTCRLLERIEAGDAEAFDGLFARHRPWLRRIVEMRSDARLRARVDPSDVVQEAHVETFRRLSDFLRRRPMPFRLWLRKTLEQRLRMIERQHLQAARRSVSREAPVFDFSAGAGPFQPAAAELTPSQYVARDELAQRVREAVLELPELDREVLLMRSFEKLSYDEVAYVLEIDAATARKRHGRALLRLHRLLVESGISESQL